MNQPVLSLVFPTSMRSLSQCITPIERIYAFRCLEMANSKGDSLHATTGVHPKSDTKRHLRSPKQLTKWKLKHTTHYKWMRASHCIVVTFQQNLAETDFSPQILVALQAHNRRKRAPASIESFDDAKLPRLWA